MPLVDLPLDELHGFRVGIELPGDFEEFWRRSLDSAAIHPIAVRSSVVSPFLGCLEVFDFSFAGWGGERVNAWLLLPSAAPRPLPCVVVYLGYGHGRGYPADHTVWAAEGWAALIVDTRGVEGSRGQPGSTPDRHEGIETPGMVTRGILDRDSYYYRRVFVDASRALDAVAELPVIDRGRIAVTGASQGGALAQAVACLRERSPGPSPVAVLVDMPFLTCIPRALELTDQEPYQEIVRFLSTRRDAVEAVFSTLRYFDGVNFASLSATPALYSVALRDAVCPPSTVFAAYNARRGPKEIRVWPYNGHEGGQGAQREEQLRYLEAAFG